MKMISAGLFALDLEIEAKLTQKFRKLLYPSFIKISGALCNATQHGCMQAERSLMEMKCLRVASSTTSTRKCCLDDEDQTCPGGGNDEL
jgi:hypothetical protein